jgi:hypothetical protein
VSLLEDFYAVENYEPGRLTPWLLRLVLDDRLTVDKHITMGMIQSRIGEEYEVRGCTATVFTVQNAQHHCWWCYVALWGLIVLTEATSCCSMIGGA